MLKIFNKKNYPITLIDDCEDLLIETNLDFDDKSLSFSYPTSLCSLIELEGFIETKNDRFVIKSKERQKSTFKTKITAVLDLDELEGTVFKNFVSTEQTIDSTLKLALAGTGWTVSPSKISKKRTISISNGSVLKIIKQCISTYMVEIKIDSLNKSISIYEKIGEDKGVYFTDELNLRDLTTQETSYDFFTEIEPYGKDGLTIEDVNDGNNFVSNYSYASKKKRFIWKDERYINASSLLEDSKLKLEDMAKPYKSYEADIINLAKISKQYKIFDYAIGDTITLIDPVTKTKEKQRIVKISHYPFKSEKDSCEIANKKLTFDELQQKYEQTSNTVDNITSTDGTIDGSSIDKIESKQIIDLENAIVNSATIIELNTKYVNVSGELQAVSIKVGQITGNIAEFETTFTKQLEALNGKINDLTTIDLKAINAKLDKAEIGIADINTLLSGSVSSGSTHTIVLNAKNTTIENALIKNAMIDTLSFDKITGIDINTSKFTVHSNDGKSLWQDNTILIKDVNRTRVQIGKDASNDYNIYIWDKNGKLMFDATGVTANGIQKPIIRDDMVSETANISGSKLNINSVIKKINEDGSENISSSKIWLDEENQSLGASFTELKDYADKGYFESIGNDYSGDATDSGIEIAKIEGAYVQETTNGYQLFDASKLPTKTQGGATVTNNGDGSFTISGSGNLTSNFQLRYDISHEILVTLFKQGTLKLNGVTNVYPFFEFYFINSSLGNKNLNNDSKQIELTSEYLNDSNTKAYMCFFGEKDAQIVTDTIKPMLYQDGDGTWESYTGGQPSPNPNSPQEPKFFEANEICSTSENMFNFEWIKDTSCAGGNKTYNDNSITLTATTTDCYDNSYNSNRRKFKIKVKPNTKYTLLFKRSASLKGTAYIFEYDSSGKTLTPYQSDGRTSLLFATTITTKSNCEYINFRVGLVTIGDTCTFSDFMFLEGEHTWDSIGNYIPYVGSSNVSTDILLRSLPNGICDTHENGIITRRVGEITFDGSDDEAWVNYQGICFEIPIQGKKYGTSQPLYNLISDKLGVAPWNIMVSKMDNLMIKENGGQSNNKVYIKHTSYTTVANFKIWLQSNPITVWYELATPTTEEFIIPKIPSYYPYTNVWHDSEVPTNITWQIKSYVETKVSQTDFAIEQGKISALISENTQIKGDVSSLNSKYNEIKASIDSFGVTIKDHTTKITNVTNTINNNKATWDKAGTALTNANNALSKIDGLKVGGRNLIKNSNFKNSTYDWQNVNCTWTVLDDTDYEHCLRFSSSQAGSASYRIHTNYMHATNTTYTLSFYAKADTDGIELVSCRGGMYNLNGKTYSLTSKWKRYTHTYTTDAVNQGSLTFWTNHPNKNVYLANVKLEIGNKPTDWTPAPEDIDNEIKTVTDKTASLQLTLDNFKTTVSNTYATKAQLNTVDGKFVNYSTTAQMNSAIDQKANEINTSVSKTYATQVQLKTANDNISALLTWKGSAEQKITDSAIVSTVTKSSSWTTLNTNVNNATTKINNLVDLTTIKDTRDKNENPQYYFTNYPKKTVKEFKNCSQIGISGEGVYGTLITEISWNDSSGGYPVQLFYPNNTQNIYRRVGKSNTAWGSWTKVAGTHNVVSTINQTAESIKIQASKIQLEGIVTANSRFKILADGSMEAVNGKFSGTINATSGTFTGKITSSTIIGSTIELTNNRTVTVYESDKDKIMNHVLGRSILTGSEFTRLDLNRDGIISSVDYVILKDILSGKFPKNFTDYVTINTSSPDKMITVGTKNGVYDTNVKIGTGKIEASYGIFNNLTTNNVKLYNGSVVFSEKGWQDGFSIVPSFGGAGDNNVLNFEAGTGGEGEYSGTGTTAMLIKGQSCTVSLFGNLEHHGSANSCYIGSSSNSWKSMYVHYGNYIYNDGHSACYTDHVGAPRVARIAFASDYVHFENTNNGKTVGIFWDIGSDISIKYGIMPSAYKAKDNINKIKFYDFYYNENDKHEKNGFIANQLEMIDKSFVYEQKDSNGNVTLVPNQQILLTYTIKALQELDNEVKELKEQIKQLTERST
ncbi:MAG: phage tail protein [Erysipelotrichaceae bacterium]|nr:phage tail protein [Erysipelotrichaceae bacterium]